MWLEDVWKGTNMTICDRILFASEPYLRCVFEVGENLIVYPRLIPLFFKIWCKTGKRPRSVRYKIDWEGNKILNIEFKDGFLYYWCFLGNDGYWVIKHFDLTDITDNDLFIRRSALISKHLTIPEKPDMWQAINYCSQAVLITKIYENMKDTHENQ